MAGSINKVILVGNLGRDPEIRNAPDGSRIATFSLATSETWRDKATGERKDRTEWHRVVIFNDKLSEVAEKYLRKGSKAYIEGQLQTRKWIDQNNQERYSTEVVLSRFRGELALLDPRSDNNTSADDFIGQSRSPAPSQDAKKQKSQDQEGASSGLEDFDDDIPF